MSVIFFFLALHTTIATANTSFEVSSHFQDKFEKSLAAQPKQTLKEAMVKANQLLHTEGILADLFFDKKADWVISQKRNFKIVPPKKVDPCDRRMTKIALTAVGEKDVHFAEANRLGAVSLPPYVRLSKVTVQDRDSKKIMATFAVPLITAPFGTSEKGDHIYFRYSLEGAKKPTKAWFQRIFEDQPEMLEDTPYLVLSVARDGELEFLDQKDAFEEQDAEPFDSDDPSKVNLANEMRAFLYHPYDWVLHFAEACEVEF